MVYETTEQFHLIEQLIIIYNQLIEEGEHFKKIYTSDIISKSRDNLFSYLSLSPKMSLDLFNQLTEIGLLPVEYSTKHVLFTLRKILENLHVPIPKQTPLSIITPKEAKKLIQTRSKQIFGHSQANIMVTLDANMLNHHDLFEKLLLNGMNIARINCAHDNEDIWYQFIERIRTAELHLRTKNNYQKRPCKIYIDLAGPKVRIGKIERETIPLKVSVQTDAYGNVVKNAIGYIDCNANHTCVLPDHTFILAIKNIDSLLEIVENDEITFIDSRNRKRVLKVLKILSPSCIMVELDKTAYFYENTVLKYHTNEYRIHSPLPSPKEIFVRKGDLLQIYLQLDKLGHPANEKVPAGVTVTLLKAFRNVRVGDRIFIDDGKIHGIVKKMSKDFIEISIVAPIFEASRIKEGHGLNLPDSLISLNVPALTNKDLSDLPFVSKYADIIGISFVHSPLDLIKLRRELKGHTNRDIPIIAKIETKDSLHQLPRIISEGLTFSGFGIMIARGDLAVEVGHENLATVQEEILAICDAAHIPTIWATGVLERMTKKGIPSRPEITDVTQGKRTNCIMLNKGPYILQSLMLLNELINSDKNSFIENFTNNRFITFPCGFFPKKLDYENHHLDTPTTDS